MDRIRSAIYDGTLQPGEPLLDHELQAWLGCSRKPIREALNDLERLGLVEMEPQRFTRVATPDGDDRTFVFQTLGALVGGITRVLVPSLGDADRATLVSEVDRVVRVLPSRDPERYNALVWPLVDLFVALCPNRILVDTTRDMIGSLSHQLRMTAATDWLRWEELDADFPVLRDAVAEGDSIAAELAVERLFRLAEPLR
ncbi:MAG TPA: GntR family transcriptional regulator [Plantibacter sp.]|uniref:GntR family transcriptional regulator n=1 Tax=unclassified Plantibacter TaxID=2624265 RepID=UPI002B809B86|nr:GntR family transcriptional regulator [Plantibacter sp.]